MNYAEVAEGVARVAHKGQVDKAGKPYIEHPQRVAHAVEDRGEYAQAVGWLHDVVEDTAITLDDLEDFGFPEHIVAAVDAITHRKGEPRSDYYRRVKMNPVALIVKLADVRDNSRSDRLDLLDRDTRMRLEAKYAAAKEILLG